MRSYLNHGRDPYYLPGYSQNPLSKKLLQKRFLFVRIGYSSRPTEMEAALGLSQLGRLGRIVHKRQAVAHRLYREMLNCNLDNFFHLPFISKDRPSSWMMFPIVLKDGLRFDKWDLCLYLERNGIETREMLPLTNQPCYKDLGFKESDYPVAQKINKDGFYVGCHQSMKTKDILHIATKMASYVDRLDKSRK